MVRLEQVSKKYRTRRGAVHALAAIDIEVKQGEFLVIRGPSGSGKTTLLLAIGGMLHPSEGRILVNGEDLYGMSDRARARYRADRVGFVFQTFHLVPYLTVVENVALAATSGDRASAASTAQRLLQRLNLAPRAHHKPPELSAGERQRTAIARALLNQPDLILADEPTGNLDPDNAGEVIGYLDEFRRAGGTVLLVTHGAVADPYADRILHLRDGRLGDS